MSLTLSRKKWIKSFIACTVALGSNLAYAQRAPIVTAEGSGHSGGGKVTESDFRAYMSKIDQYLQTLEGALVFPEIVAYDKAHPAETFHDIIMNTKPSVKPGKLFDANGEERDCMSYATPTFRYFVCNSDALPEKTLDTQPSFYRIVLHELLVQAGIEKPISKAVPSDYAISYRITENVHLETYQEWVPGKKTPPTIIAEPEEMDFRKLGMLKCNLADPENYFSPNGRKMGLVAIIKKGNIWLYEYGEPTNWGKYSNPEYLKAHLNTVNAQWAFDNLIGKKPHLTLLFSAKVKFRSEADSIQGEAQSADLDQVGNPQYSVKLKLWSSDEEFREKSMHPPFASIPFVINYGKTYGRNESREGPAYSSDLQKSASLFCNINHTPLSNSVSDDEYRLLSIESLKPGQIPYEWNPELE